MRVLATSINPADLNQIEGRYPILPKALPAIPGNESVGEVLEVGSAVSGLKTGDWCVPSVAGAGGQWRTHWGPGPAASWIGLPPGLMPLESAATLTVSSCTALRMLEDFVELRPGVDAVVQNGGTSAVGRAVTQLCRARGISSVSLLRRRAKSGGASSGTTDDEAMRAEILALGADHVLFEDEIRDRKPQLRGLNFSLGLNCVGGESGARVAKLLAHGAHLVTYGGMSKEPVVGPTGLFVFKDLRFRGFWMTRWMNDVATTDDKAAMISRLAELIRRGALHSAVEIFDLETEWRQAIEMATAPSKAAKPVLRCCSRWYFHGRYR